jgi:chromosome segregation ATPase
MPRTAEQIEAELDAWQTKSTEQETREADLREQLASLSSKLALLPQGSAGAPETVALLESLRTELQESKASQLQATARIAALETQLISPKPEPKPAPEPNPKSDVIPPAPQDPPQPKRQTRHNWL